MDPNDNCIQSSLTEEEKKQKWDEFYKHQYYTVPIYNGFGAANVIIGGLICVYLLYFVCRKRKLP